MLWLYFILTYDDFPEDGLLRQLCAGVQGAVGDAIGQEWALGEQLAHGTYHDVKTDKSMLFLWENYVKYPVISISVLNLCMCVETN